MWRPRRRKNTRHMARSAPSTCHRWEPRIRAYSITDVPIFCESWYQAAWAALGLAFVGDGNNVTQALSLSGVRHVSSSMATMPSRSASTTDKTGVQSPGGEIRASASAFSRRFAWERFPRSGFVTLTGLLALGWHRSKRDHDQLPRLPLPIRGHPAGRVAVLTLHAELPGCGGSAGRTGHHRLLRNHPAVGRPLRSADRRPICAVGAGGRTRPGTSTKWSCRSVAGGCISGAPSMPKARSSTCSFRPGVTPGRRAG
jgi:hypothetical protein